jgi:copper chaperone for superoxide dismutase
LFRVGYIFLIFKFPGSGGTSAVSIIDRSCGNDDIKGVIRFCANSKTQVGTVIDGAVDGLKIRTSHSFSICEYGDLSQNCENLGSVYNDFTYDITSDENGKFVFRLFDEKLCVGDLIGRSVMISQNNKKLACGIIARSAGIFENFKRICACDGVKIWDERDRPLVGPGRRLNSD